MYFIHEYTQLIGSIKTTTELVYDLIRYLKKAIFLNTRNETFIICKNNNNETLYQTKIITKKIVIKTRTQEYVNKKNSQNLIRHVKIFL